MYWFCRMLVLAISVLLDASCTDDALKSYHLLAGERNIELAGSRSPSRKLTTSSLFFWIKSRMESSFETLSAVCLSHSRVRVLNSSSKATLRLKWRLLCEITRVWVHRICLIVSSTIVRKIRQSCCIWKYVLDRRNGLVSNMKWAIVEASNRSVNWRTYISLSYAWHQESHLPVH